MSRSRLLLSRCVLGAACVALVVPAAAVAAEPEFAIAAGLESVFLDLVNPRPARFAGTWAVQGVALDKSVATVRYVDSKGALVRIKLIHPRASSAASALATTERFALLADSAPPPPRALVEELARRLRARESTFQWTAVRPPQAPIVEGAPGPSPPPLHNMPVLPEDAMPPDWLRGPDYGLSGAARTTWDQALLLLKQGKPDAARTHARELASSAPAAAALLRRLGDAPAAMALLAPLVPLAPGGPDPPSDALRIQLAATHELDGKPVEAAKVLAGLATPPAGGAACARAAALTLLVIEGRGADVMKRTEADWTRGPRCVLQLRMRAAMSQANQAAVDAAGEAAALANPGDQNLLYMWGSYYYNLRRFKEAQRGWDRLAQVNPKYPGFLGLYGTALHIQGVLKGRFLDEQIARARKNPDDVIANHLAGLGRYYERRYAESLLLFANVRRLSDEPRAGMYLAMSHFFTGDVEPAIALLDELEPMGFREPDIYYCRSLVWRFYDLPRAIKEMQSFIDVNDLPDRPSFGPQKVLKAREDMIRLKRGEIPSVYLAGQGEYIPPPRKQRQP